MLQEALLFDRAGRPIADAERTHSRDWDEVQDFCRRVYMPYKVQPLGKALLPDATMRKATVGRITVSRFSYGVPIHLSDFDPGTGNVMVLNTLRGSLRHLCDARGDAVTRAGDSFVVDCSRTDYWLDGDEDHMQLNLTIAHDVVAEVALRWFDFVPDDRLWTRRLAFGGPGTRWQHLLAYAVQSVDARLGRVPSAAIARHLEEMICLELLETWAAGAGVSLRDGARAAAPYYVREAEEILAREARDPPTIGEIAVRVGVSARTLSEGFQRFRGLSPRSFLRARRLDGFRAALEAALPGETVTGIAADWGYANFGALAAAYREKFGELPSRTLARATARF